MATPNTTTGVNSSRAVLTSITALKWASSRGTGALQLPSNGVAGVGHPDPDVTLLDASDAQRRIPQLLSL